MKLRNDFVSNSSSCSFMIDNLKEIKFDSNFVNLLMSANYIQFFDVNYGNMRKVKYGKTLSAFNRFKDEVEHTFGNKANIDFEHRDSENSPPEEVYVELDTDNFFRGYNANKRDLLERLVANSDTVHLDFGDDCEGGIERATQTATLFDYIYGLNVISDGDHFDYSPVEDIGIMKDNVK